MQRQIIPEQDFLCENWRAVANCSQLSQRDEKDGEVSFQMMTVTRISVITVTVLKSGQ